MQTKNPFIILIAVLLILPTTLAWSDDFSTNTSANYSEQVGAVFSTGYMTLYEPELFDPYTFLDAYAMPKYDENSSLIDYINGENVTTLFKPLGGIYAGVCVKAGPIEGSDVYAGGYCAVHRGSDNKLWFLNAGEEDVTSGSCGTMSVGSVYWIKARYTGTNFQAKFWLNGTAEPASWCIDETYSAATYNGPSEFFISMFTQGADAEYYYFEYTGYGSIPCVPDWSCDGYGTPVCYPDDTSNASCNSVTDLNVCGESYTGDYSEFPDQVGVCDYCTPSWSCSSYDDCTPENVLPCLNVTDANACGEPFTGNLTVYDDSCEYNQITGSVTAKVENAINMVVALFLAMVVFSLLAVFITRSDMMANNPELKKVIVGVSIFLIAVMLAIILSLL